MRILTVCQTDLRSGSGKHAMWFGQQLARQGHEVLLSLHGDPDSAASEGALGVNGFGAHFHEFRGRRLRRGDIAAARAFAPTVIHAFNARLPAATAARAYARATGAPVCVHWEDDEFGVRDRVHTSSLVRKLATRVRGPLSVVYPPALPAVTSGTMRWARRAAGHDALTPSLATWVEETLGRPCSVVLPITPHVHDDLPVASDVLADFAGRPVLMIAGSLHGGSLADVKVALVATAMIRARGHDAAFVHCGPVQMHIDAATLISSTEGLSGSDVRFLGYQPSLGFPALLREATVLLQPGEPSPYNRLRLPSKVQAYLASGVPVITFASGFGALLEDGVDALKLHTHEPEELALAVLSVLEDSDLSARLARGGRVAAQRLFDPEANGTALGKHLATAAKIATK